MRIRKFNTRQDPPEENIVSVGVEARGEAPKDYFIRLSRHSLVMNRTEAELIIKQLSKQLNEKP